MATNDLEFPFRWWMTDADIELLELTDSLRVVLDSVSSECMSKWEECRDDGLFTEAAASLTIAGATLQVPVMRWGRIVISKMKPYWLKRTLISDVHIAYLGERMSRTFMDKLAEALELEQKLRSSALPNGPRV